MSMTNQIFVKYKDKRVPACYDNDDGMVWVWDDIAQHFTSCHDLTPAQIKYVKAKQAKQ